MQPDAQRPSAPRPDAVRRAPGGGLLRGFWARVATALVLLLATPSAAQVVQQGFELLGGCACCDDEADHGDEAEAGSPGTCAHCACCTPSNALPPPVAPTPRGLADAPPSFGGPPARLYASGYRAELFRPPAA